MELFLIVLLSFFSALVTSVFRFGAGLVLTPLLGFLMPLPEALGMASLVFLFTSGSKALWYFHDIDWDIQRRALLLSLPGLLIGFAIVRMVDLRMLETAYALLLILFAVNMLLHRDQTKSLLPKASYPVAGGVLSVLMHSGGVFFFRYAQFYSLNRVRLVGTIAVIHFLLNIFKVIFFTGTGLVASSALYRLAPAYLAAIVGTRIGRTVLSRYVNERLFTQGVAILLLMLACRYLLALV